MFPEMKDRDVNLVTGIFLVGLAVCAAAGGASVVGLTYVFWRGLGAVTGAW
jgi:hypothetical protein